VRKVERSERCFKSMERDKGKDLSKYQKKERYLTSPCRRDNIGERIFLCVKMPCELAMLSHGRSY